MATLPTSSQELSERMNEEREAAGATLNQLRQRLRRDLDARRQLARHARLALLAAAMLGWIGGRALRRLLG